MERLKKIRKSIVNSFKSVLFNFKEFVCIYVAIVIVQLLFGVWTLSAYTNYHANDEMFNSAYAHDVMITGSGETLTKLANKINFDIGEESAIVEDFALYKDTLGVDLRILFQYGWIVSDDPDLRDRNYSFHLPFFHTEEIKETKP